MAVYVGRTQPPSIITIVFVKTGSFSIYCNRHPPKAYSDAIKSIHADNNQRLVKSSCMPMAERAC